MPGKIFVNYRRDDSASHALNVAQYLEATFGKRNVFLDIDRMRAGQSFPAVLQERLAASKVMLAVIGPQWLELRNEHGQRRIDDPGDWVRLEIATALRSGTVVIPVLVGGASLPRKADLPPDLQPLTDQHAVTVTTNGFRNEMAGLARDIRAVPGPKSWRLIGGGAVAALALLAAGWVGAHQPGVPVWVPFAKGSDSPGLTPAADAARKVAETAKVKADADRLAEAEAKLLAEQEARRQAEARAKQLADAADKAKREQDARDKAARDEAARRKAEDDARRRDPVAALVPGSGQSARDCPECPEMVVVPAGSFMMGATPAEIAALRKKSRFYSFDAEGPQRTVTIRQNFAVGKFEVTFAEWDACVAGGGCTSNRSPSDDEK